MSLLFSVAQVEAALPNLTIKGSALENLLRNLSVLVQGPSGADRPLGITRFREGQTVVRGIFRTSHTPVVVGAGTPILLEVRDEHRVKPYGRSVPSMAWRGVPESELTVDAELGHVEFDEWCKHPQQCRLTYHAGYDLNNINDPSVATMFDLMLAMVSAVEINGGDMARGLAKAIRHVDQYEEEYYQPDAAAASSLSPLAFGLEGFKAFKVRMLKV
jgi:hypothetical protein